MNFRRLLLFVSIGTILSLLSTESMAMSKALNFVSQAGSKVAGFFGNGSSSYSSCTRCESAYSGPKPPIGSGFPAWQYHSKGKEWTAHTLAAIDREGLAYTNPKDAAVYCPNWKNMTLQQKRSFWLNFSSKLAEQESGLRSTQTFFESKGASFGSSSNGLFSMSVGDCSNLQTTQDTITDSKNISCAIKTMKSYLNKHGGYIGTGSNKGLGYYWQPLNDNPKYYVAETLANKRALLNFTRVLPYCRATISAEFSFLRGLIHGS